MDSQKNTYTTIDEYIAQFPPEIQARLNEMRTGAGTPMIPRQEFGEIVIPLPPLVTQKRIADLAALQTRENALLQQLVEETERLHLLSGKQLLSHMINSKQE